MNEFKLRYSIWYMCVCLGLWFGAFYIVLRQSGEELSQMAAAAVVGLVILGMVFGVGALVSLFNYIWKFANERMWEVRRAQAVTPALELARAISLLRPDQTQLLPQARYAAEVGVVPGLNSPEHFLITPFMNIPLAWVDEYVNEMCSRVELYPVRRFSSESVEQKYAQAFTAWVTQPHLHLAIPANGPDPAKWISPGARQRCVEMIWGEEEDNNHE